MTTLATTSLPQQLARLDTDRLARYRQYLDFYRGDQWTSPQRRRERRLTLNYAKAVVEKTVSYLMADVSLTARPWQATPEGEARARAAELALDRVAEDNNLAQLDFDTELDAAVLGDACYKVTWDPAAGRVRVTAPDVHGIYAWWAGDDVGRVWRVASRYALPAEEAEALYGARAAAGIGNRRGNGAREVIVTEVWTADRFELWLGTELHETKANPYGFIPFVLFANLREPHGFWGVSDLAAAMEPARELNRAMTQLSHILELSGNPIAVLENVEGAEDIAVAPGAVWELPERAKAYLLDLLQGGGVQLHASYIDLLYRTLHDLTETPRTSFGDNARALSGVALEMELHPLLQKVKRKRLIRSAVYRQRAHMALRLLEQKAGADFRDVRLAVQWSGVLPQDRSRLVTDETALVAAGIHSRRTAADLLGVPDPEAEWARWRAEADGVSGAGAGGAPSVG